MFFGLVSIFKIFSIQSPSIDDDHLVIKSGYEYQQRYVSRAAPIICASNYFFYLGNWDRFNYKKYPFPNLNNLQGDENKVVIWDSKFFAKECKIDKRVLEELGFKKLKSFINLKPFYEVAIFVKEVKK